MVMLSGLLKPRLHQIHVARIQVVSSGIHLYPDTSCSSVILVSGCIRLQVSGVNAVE